MVCVVLQGVAIRLSPMKGLSREAQEELRIRAVAAHLDHGLTQAQVAELFGTTERSVSRWVAAFREHGRRGLKSGIPGQRPEAQKRLDKRQTRGNCTSRSTTARSTPRS